MDEQRSAPLLAAWLCTHCQGGTDVASSGNRGAARLERPARQRDEETNRFNRAIDERYSELQRDRGRSRGKPISYRAGGKANRAEIIGFAIIGMILTFALIRQTKRRKDQALVGILPRDMNVAEGYRKVDCERDKRKP
jgi:hypothetical protein